MAGRDRVAAVRRAREMQTRIETAAVRIANSQRKLQRARDQRQRALDQADTKVAAREHDVDVEVQLLVEACGSPRYAAEVLGLPERQVKQMTKRAHQSQEHAIRHAPTTATGGAPETPGND
jgi:hypothetical protein